MSSPVPEPPFHLFIAGIFSVGISCARLWDETQQAVTPWMDCSTSQFGLIAEVLLIVILISV